MHNSLFPVRRLAAALMVCLSLAFAMVSFAAEEGGRKPATPNEINAGLTLAMKEIGLSSDGRWASFASTRGPGFADVQNGGIRNAGDPSNTAERWNLLNSAWSPAAPMLAFRLYREGKSVLAVWTTASRRARELLEIPRDLYPSFPPAWSPDGKTLFLVVGQDLPWVKSRPEYDYPATQSNNVQLQLARPYKKERPPYLRFGKEYPEAHAENRRSLIMMIDVASGAVGVLGKGNDIDSLYVSPDGRKLAVLQIKYSYPDKPAGWNRQFGDVYLLDIPASPALSKIDLEALEDRKAGWSDHAGTRLTPIQTNVLLMQSDDGVFPRLQWSPDSARLAYATVGLHAAGDVFVYELATRQLRNLTEGIVLADSGKTLGYAQNRVRREIAGWDRFGDYKTTPLWLPDGSALLAMGRAEVWKLPLAAGEKPGKLTSELPQESIRLLPAFRDALAATDKQGNVIVVAKDRQSRNDSLWRLDPRSGRSTRFADTGMWLNEVMVSDARNELMLYTGQSLTSLTNIHRLRLNGEAAPEYLTRYKLELAERVFPESRVLSWKTPAGQLAYGLLYLPAGASAQNKAPMILDTDASDDGFSQVDSRAAHGANFYQDTLHGLLKDGFAVLYPDVPLSNEGIYEQPLKQASEGILAALDAALATGTIDEKRLGIVGWDYGAFMTQAVLTQTTRFTAAVSAAGVSNWAAHYMKSPDSTEAGKGRMGVPIWGEPYRYLDNSPLRYLDRIRTPLLLLHGEQDFILPVFQSEDMFTGLEQLGRPTVFALYRRASHDVPPEMEQRIRGWFREHLLGAVPMSHIADQGSFMLGGNADDASRPAPEAAP